MPGNILFVVTNPDRWPLKVPGVDIVAARQYLADARFSQLRRCKVYNLSRSYSYQSLGYYVSLLAEARGHKPIPTASTLQDLKYQSLLRVVSGELEEEIQHSLAPLQSNSFTLSIYFSCNLAKRYRRLSRLLFNLFPVPLLRAQFKRSAGKWSLQSISAIGASDIPDSHRSSVVAFAAEYFSKGSSVSKRKPARYRLAILAGKDPTPPSDEKALRRFSDAAEDLSIATEIIDKDDYGRLEDFDALFIRETTAVNNHTYRFARRAEAEGLVVIDDPISILRCTNKVYLAELLTRHKIPIPRTEYLNEENTEQVLATLGLPCILKQPDSSFSLGVVKVETQREFTASVSQLLEKSDILIAQEFMRTDFDWRIGIIDRKPLYACQYFMARGHWQIYNAAAPDKESADFSGNARTLPVEMVPKRILKTALKAANLIGDGFYGVDVKEVDGKPYLIEINDNPSIDAGVEDKILHRTLYERVMEVFYRRLESKRLTNHS